MGLPLMMGFRRQLALRPINTKKEVIDSTLLGVAAATTSTVVIALAVDNYSGSIGECQTGAVIKGGYWFVQILPTTGTANVDAYIAKAPLNVVTNLPIPGAVGGNVHRKYILHEKKGIPGNSADGAYPMTIEGSFRIPKGRQRMAESDQIVIRVRGTDIHNACIKAIYKVYS